MFGSNNLKFLEPWELWNLVSDVEQSTEKYLGLNHQNIVDRSLNLFSNMNKTTSRNISVLDQSYIPLQYKSSSGSNNISLDISNFVLQSQV